MSTSAEHPAFSAVAQTALDPVYRYVTHLCGDRDLAEDLTAQAFELALRRWARFDPDRGEPLPWLLAIARRVALDHFRSERRRSARERSVVVDPSTARVAGDPAEEDMGLSADLRAALGRLTRAERELIALRVLLELDVTETGALVGASPSAVSSGLHRALLKLRREVTRDAS